MPQIYLARHGQNEDNANGILNGHRDMPLTDIGLAQARQLAENIRKSGISFDKIYSSPLQRAFRTGEVVAETLGLAPPEKLDLLIERNFGIMTGQPASEIERLCAPDILKTDTITYFLSPEKAETFPDLLERAGKLLAFLEQKTEYEHILLTCHGDIGKMIYARFYNEDWRDILTGFHFGNGELLVLDHACPADSRHVIKLDQFNH